MSKSKYNTQTFIKVCSKCWKRNRVPIRNGPDVVKCHFCKEKMLTRTKCHCGVVSYTPYGTKVCCHRCRCTKCTKCKKVMPSSKFDGSGICGECQRKSRYRKCKKCGGGFKASNYWDIDRVCPGCELEKKCDVCRNHFTANHKSNLQCPKCVENIDSLLGNPEAKRSKFYQKVEMVIDYTAYDYQDFNCDCVGDGSGCDCEARLGDGKKKKLVYPVPKFISDDNIDSDNEISGPIWIYLERAGLLKGDKNDILKIHVRKRKLKITLE